MHDNNNNNKEPLPARKKRRMMTSFSLLSSSSSSSRCSSSSSSSRIFSSKRRHQQQRHRRHLGKRFQRRLRARESTDDENENDDEKEKEEEGNNNEDDLYSVCVLGAGPAGLTTALAMQNVIVAFRYDKETDALRLKITVLDKNPNALDGNVGGGFNINGGAAVLEKLGVYEEVFSKNANALRAVLSRRSRYQLEAALVKLGVEKKGSERRFFNERERVVGERKEWRSYGRDGHESGFESEFAGEFERGDVRGCARVARFTGVGRVGESRVEEERRDDDRDEKV